MTHNAFDQSYTGHLWGCIYAKIFPFPFYLNIAHDPYII